MLACVAEGSVVEKAMRFGHWQTRGLSDRIALSVTERDWRPHRVLAYRYRDQLISAWSEYVSTVSVADHAVSLESATYLLWLCERLAPRRLLDTGSGFSSYVLRGWAANHDATVLSLDNDLVWLRRTENYLASKGLSTDGLMEWDKFDALSHEPFDLVLHDLGDPAVRVASMEAIAGTVAPAGVVLFDDLHFQAVYKEARRVTAVAGRRFLGLRPVTIDPLRRYAGLSCPQ
jgi:predicted O-methyltransferase YrrM